MVLLVFHRFGLTVLFYRCTSKEFTRKSALAKTWDARFVTANRSLEMKRYADAQSLETE